MIRLLIAAPFLLLTACDGGGDPVQQALRDASAERQAAAVKDGTIYTIAVADPDGPEKAREAAAIQHLISQNEESLAYATAALSASDDPELRRMAQQMIDARTAELAALRAWKPAAN